MNKNEYIERVNILLVELSDRERKAEEIRQEIGQVKASLDEVFAGGKQYLSVEERISAAHQWYWHTDLNTTIIATFLDVAVNSVCRSVGPLPSGIHCKCGQEYMLASRQARQELKSWGATRSWQCKTCQKKRERASQARWEKEKQDKEAAIERYRDMPYKLYLQSEHWQSVRKAALKRARYRCQLCSASKRLQVHHNTYENRGDEKPQDVIVLCRSCHEKYHDIGNGYRIPDEYSDIIIG